MRIPDFVIVGPVWDISGVAESVRNLYVSLFDLGIKVKLFEIPGWSHLKADLDPILREKLQLGFERNDLQQPVVIHMYPPHAVISPPAFDGAAFNVSFTVFETDKCPLVWRDLLNSQFYLENWVACNFQVEAYSSMGLNKDKLKVIPHGVDSLKYNPNVQPLEISGRKPFAIGTALDWSLRKNPQAILASFMQEFNNEPDACLVIKAYTGWGDDGSKNKIRSEIQKMRMMTRSNASVLLITDFMHSDTMPRFHKSLDSWVNLSRGEGWDMGTLQSMACGVPAILADNTSHSEYASEKDSYMVKCSKVPISNKDFLARTPQFLDHSWWEVDVKNARAKMRQAFEDWKTGKLQEKGKEARNSALAYPWKNTAIRCIFNAAKYFR